MSDSSDQDADRSGIEQSERAGREQPATDTEGAATGRRDPGGTSATDVLTKSVPEQYVLGIVGTLAVLAVGLFLLVLLLTSFGGPSITTEQADDLPQEGQNLLEDAYAMSVASTAISVGPYAALAVVTGFGFLVGRTLDRRRNDKLLVSAVGAGAGTALFLVLLTVLVASQLPSGEALSEAGGTMASGVFGTEVDYGQLLVNAILLGIAGATIAAGAAYVADRVELDGAAA